MVMRPIKGSQRSETGPTVLSDTGPRLPLMSAQGPGSTETSSPAWQSPNEPTVARVSVPEEHFDLLREVEGRQRLLAVVAGGLPRVAIPHRG